MFPVCSDGAVIDRQWGGGGGGNSEVFQAHFQHQHWIAIRRNTFENFTAIILEQIATLPLLASNNDSLDEKNISLKLNYLITCNRRCISLFLSLSVHDPSQVVLKIYLNVKAGR